LENLILQLENLILQYY